jgi:hypothetical protein
MNQTWRRIPGGQKLVHPMTVSIMDLLIVNFLIKASTVCLSKLMVLIGMPLQYSKNKKLFPTCSLGRNSNKFQFGKAVKLNRCLFFSHIQLTQYWIHGGVIFSRKRKAKGQLKRFILHSSCSKMRPNDGILHIPPRFYSIP